MTDPLLYPRGAQIPRPHPPGCAAAVSPLAVYTVFVSLATPPRFLLVDLVAFPRHAYRLQPIWRACRALLISLSRRRRHQWWARSSESVNVCKRRPPQTMLQASTQSRCQIRISASASRRERRTSPTRSRQENMPTYFLVAPRRAVSWSFSLPPVDKRCLFRGVRHGQS